LFHLLYIFSPQRYEENWFLPNFGAVNAKESLVSVRILGPKSIPNFLKAFLPVRKRRVFVEFLANGCHLVGKGQY
jgi:hypothetical protein